MNQNQFAKTSILKVTSALKEGRAYLSDVAFTAPFKIMKPFSVGERGLQILVLTASAGIMEGDTQEIEITVGEETSLEFLTQAYEKIHKMEEGEAVRKTKLIVKKNAKLNYHPLPTIPFAKSAYKSETEIELEDESSKLIFTEVLSCGRAARGEKFEYRYYHNLVTAKQDGHYIYRDNTVYDPDKFNMEKIGMYEGYTHFASMLICNHEIEDEILIRMMEFLDETEQIEGAVTRTAHNDIAIRILGRSGQKLTDICKELEEYIV